MLPKPGKNSTQMCNLRPLALQELVGKAIIRLLTELSLHQCFDDLSHLPQYAYLPWRSTRNAILRLAKHCSGVREILKDTTRSSHVPTAHQPGLPCCGGIQLFMDLHLAFDQLPRPTLLEALNRVELNPSLFTLLMAWHQQTHYHLNVNDTHRCIQVSRMVRQHCCAAPFLWSCTMALLLDKLSQRIPLRWIQQHITVFADDIHVACTFHTEQALLDGIRYFGYLVDEIKNLGLLLSPSKSCIVFRGSGRRYQYWRNKFLSTSADGGRLFHLPTSDGTLPIPVKRKCTYLGVVMSYENYELQTMQMRMKAGWNQYRQSGSAGGDTSVWH